MAKIIFYNTTDEEKVNKFIESLNEGERREEQFITFGMLSARTGITAESKSASVVSAIISVITMVNANIFVPFTEHIEDEIVTYVNTNKDSMAPIEFFYINEKGWKDSTNIELSKDEDIRYTMFVPKTVSILYLSTINSIEKTVQDITPTKSRFVFDMPRIKELTKIDDDTRIALAFPQITAASSLEFTKILEDALKINPVDIIIFEEDEHGLDFFLRMVRNAVPNMEHKYYIDTPAYTVEETEDENDIEENIEEVVEETTPTVEAEVVSEES